MRQGRRYLRTKARPPLPALPKQQAGVQFDADQQEDGQD
jgi:hypothetical protein